MGNGSWYGLPVSFKRHDRALLVVVTAVSLVACSGRPEQRVSTPCHTSTADPAVPLQLVACVAKPTGNGAGPSFFVGLKNTSSEPVWVRARFEWSAAVQVRRLDGELGPKHWEEPATIPFRMTTYLLPRGGVVGRDLDLGCMVPDIGTESRPCYSVFDWEPGEYEFRFDYVAFAFCQGESCGPGDVEDWKMPFYATSAGFKIKPIRMRLRADSGWEAVP